MATPDTTPSIRRPSHFAQCASCFKAAEAESNATLRVEQDQSILRFDTACTFVPDHIRQVYIDVDVSVVGGEEGNIPAGKHRSVTICPVKDALADAGRTDMSRQLS